MTFSYWMILGFCSGWIPGNHDLSIELCLMQYEAEQRQIILPGPSDAERDLFYVAVSRLVHTASSTYLTDGWRCLK